MCSLGLHFSSKLFCRPAGSRALARTTVLVGHRVLASAHSLPIIVFPERSPGRFHIPRFLGVPGGEPHCGMIVSLLEVCDSRLRERGRVGTSSYWKKLYVSLAVLVELVRDCDRGRSGGLCVAECCISVVPSPSGSLPSGYYYYYYYYYYC